MTYYAHTSSTPDKTDWQPLDQHLVNVSTLAAHFAESFHGGEWGKIAGLLHDAGKATHQFTRRLEGSATRVDHAGFGAQLAQQRAGKLGLLLSYAITGHHGGLPDGGLQEGQLHYRLKNAKVADDTFLLPEVDITCALQPPFVLDRKMASYSLAMFTKMIFSCLVDADFLDTERFCSPERHTDRQNQAATDLSTLYKSLKNFIAELEQNTAASKVNTLRKAILSQCRKAAQQDQGFFSLTVPTGGGKTLSSLSFALEHGARHHLARVIYAIPFTSIIEQNAAVFRKALGDEQILEHHCNYKDRDNGDSYDRWRSLASENWDAPVVVTTNVQFFESLYSHKTSRCRKLHNLANSVIVLDEAQAIPTEFLEPCLAALKELVNHYGCSIVLCTATQPVLDEGSSLKNHLPSVREIIDNPQQLFTDLARVRIEPIGSCSTEALAARLDTHRQVLAIVPTKKQAQRVFTALANQEEGYHLSTNMYPAHRLETLNRIRLDLETGKPCRVVATSLVEAGVDLDFPVVYRAIAGLDSIAQAAGRCNREGRLEYGQVYVYEPDAMPAMPWLRRRISRAKEALRTLPDADWLGLEVMRRYFTLLFDAEDLDKHRIVHSLNPPCRADLILPFREVSEKFRLIDDEGTGVIIPLEPSVEELVAQLREIPAPKSVLRALQRYSVTVRSTTLSRLEQSGAVEIVAGCYPVLRNLQMYHPSLGLMEEMMDLWDPEALVV